MTNYCYLCNVVNGCAYKVLGKDLCIKEVDVYSVLAWGIYRDLTNQDGKSQSLSCHNVLHL